jgi:uncharacterized membrane protein
MMWLGLVVGLVLGALWHGFDAAVALGFVGWLAGLIAAAVRGTKTAKPEDRLRTLEARLTAIEARLARMEAGGVVAAQRAPAQQEFQAESAEPAMAAETIAPPQAAAQSEPTSEPASAPPREPPKPNPIVAWLTGGNTIARVGLVILFLGLAFLLKWAVDHAVLPPELRVAGVALVGVALLVFGWRLRQRRSGYALGLQGGGVAVLYLTTFAALRLYGLLPPVLAFALLAAIAVFSAVLAVMQDALVLAAFGAGGGFLAPILASTGQGSHVALFSYYLLLNLGIAGIALFRSWRSLNIMGFLFTFVIGAIWGVRFYTPEFFETTEPFLVAFFLLYVAIAVVQALRMAPAGKPYLDGILVFGTPIAAFSLQAGLVRDTEYGLAFSCIAASALYLVLATALLRRDKVRMLFECFLALGVVFLTLAVPLALDARWTSALWALEGAAVVWIGVRQRRRVATGFGLLMQALAGGAFVHAFLHMPPGVGPLDAVFLGAMLLALAGIWTSRRLADAPWRLASGVFGRVLFLVGFAWLLLGVQYDFQRFMASRTQVEAWVALYAALAVIFLAMSRRWAWPTAAWPSLAFVPVLAIQVLATIREGGHPFTATGAAAWAIALAAHLWILRRQEGGAMPRWLEVEHLGGALVFIAIVTLELHYRAVTETVPHSAWSAASWVVPASLALIALSARALDARWPVDAKPRAYRYGLPAILAVLFALWILFANVTHDGRSDPLPYLPLLNALDLAHILAGIALVFAWRAAARSGIELSGDARRAVPIIVAALAFFWLNGVLLRTLHHWAAIPYRLDPMLRSMLVQASLSIFWSLLALALMLFAARRMSRPLWITGAALMAVVVAKLFVVELSHVAGFERIVSFIVVGVLMLAIGYAAPVPPRVKEAHA